MSFAKPWLSAAGCIIALTAAAQTPETPTFVQVVQPFVDQGRFAGAVGVVVLRDKIVAFPVAGYADIASQKPMTRDTLFWIASTSKPFQATAVMMLVDDGKVRLDDPVSKYLPGFDPPLGAKATDGTVTLKAPSRPLTLRTLLNHTSGLNYDHSRKTPADGTPLAEHVADLAKRPLLHEPGAAFVYSDAGMHVASRVVEVVSGMPFDRFLEERLLKPLGMVDTTFIPTEAQVARLATAYWIPPDSGKLTPVPDALAQPRPRAQLSDRKLRHAPMGGLFSTGADLARFASMFLNEGELDGRRYLSKTSVAEMTRNQISAEAAPTVPQPPVARDVPTTYGLGWGIAKSGAYFHPGMASTNLRVEPAREIVAIFLAQHGADATALEIQVKLGDALYEHFPLRD
jgi:CubicO group peptidase (beta-lactamase class C family)